MHSVVIRSNTVIFFLISSRKFLLFAEVHLMNTQNVSLREMVPYLSFFWCLGRAVFGDCGISWVSLLIFFVEK